MNRIISHNLGINIPIFLTSFQKCNYSQTKFEKKSFSNVFLKTFQLFKFLGAKGDQIDKQKN